MSTNTGTITLPTPSAFAIWNEEITGQLSDGMWENTTPTDHWRFWCNLTTELGEPKVVSHRPYLCLKTRYNLASLIPLVGDRMLKTGRMARALHTLRGERRWNDGPVIRCAAYMPETLGDWNDTVESCSPLGLTIARQTFGDVITQEIAEAFYGTSYTTFDLRADIRSIRTAMKNVRDVLDVPADERPSSFR